MKVNKKVIIFTEFFLPGYKGGGPIKSVKNIIDNLKEEIEFFVLTSSRDLNADHDYDNVKIDEWNSINDAQVYYFSNSNFTIKKVKKLINSINADSIYLNSLFSNYTLVPLIAVWLGKIETKVILAPRGELHAGALAIKSNKKKLFLAVFKRLYPVNRLYFQSTDSQESQDIVSHLKVDELRVLKVPNLIGKNTFEFQGFKKKPGELKLVFYSRIVKKKNLLFLLNILKNKKYSGNLVLNIFGSIESEEYWKICQKIIELLPRNIQVEYRGSLKPVEISYSLSKHHFFVLPTFGENFGHVIVEAMQSSLPLLISDQTPWVALNEKQIGYDLPLEKEAWEIKIQDLIDLSEENYSSFRNNSFLFIEDLVDQQEAKIMMRELFK